MSLTRSTQFEAYAANDAGPAVDRFLEVIQGASEPHLLDFDGIEGEAGRSKSITQECVSLVEERITSHPSERLYTGSQTDREALAGKTQSFRVDRTSGAESSAHQVFFGGLTGNTGTVNVAIKPMDRRGALMAEWVNLHLVRRRGFETFRPMGMMLTNEGGFLLTERRDKVESMDNADWASTITHRQSHEAMLDDLRKVGPVLAGLHDAGIFHGDAQLKNVVMDQKGGIYFIDWEAATIVEPPIWGELTEIQSGEVGIKTEKDLKALFGSLLRARSDGGVGMLNGLTPDTQFSIFRELVLTPYLEERLTLLEKGTHVAPEELLLQLGEVEERIENYIKAGELYKTLARTRRE